MDSREIAIPFAPLRVAEALRPRVEAIARRANDRYVQEVLEAHRFCPFAREARKQSRTEVVVYIADPCDIDLLCGLLEDRAAGEKEVVQVVFAAAEAEPKEFSAFCHALTDEAQARIGRKVFAVAPLHPRLEYSREAPLTIVPLLRRAPDPTLQWVRLATLDEVYAGREEERFVDPDHLAHYLARPAVKPLYDRIADNNFQEAQRLGFERLEALFTEIADEARRAYREVLPALFDEERS